MGSTHAFFPFFLDSQNERTSGICAPHAGLGHLTVRAHSQAITVRSRPTYGLRSSRSSAISGVTRTLG
ncbi:MAG TPA: hypothetical protein ENF88_01730 [Candidatus Acetothermia bacterium]|nr:hypothetical protein [Candidatus Acetothermia bacterium]HEX32394.1 hypothetical protein [Candidatus Acetothermia bacterium]